MAYFDCIVGGSGKGNTLVVTCADDLAGATITCTNGTKTYNKTCPSTSPYEVTFYGLEAGTWTVSATVSGSTYTATVVITDYEAELGGFSWRAWVDTAQYLDSTDYASLSEVLADEEAVRELCLEHACVDYLAAVPSVNADIETIINNDLFAKWVNNSDYSLDILGANVAIKALMDTADKYGYGEWVITDDTTTPPTWGPKGNVPVMTSNTAPYGTASNQSSQSGYEAYKAFDGNDSTYAIGSSTAGTGSGPYIAYKFAVPTNVRKILHKNSNSSASDTNVIKYSDDGSTWTSTNIQYTIGSGEEKYVDVSDCGYHLYWGIFKVSSTASTKMYAVALQFYGRELSVSVPKMDTNTTPYGTAFANSELGTSFKEFNAFTGMPTSGTNYGWAPATNGEDSEFGYEFTTPCKALKMVLDLTGNLNSSRTFDIVVKASKDGTNYENIKSFRASNNQGINYVDLDTDDVYKYYKIHSIFYTSQSYGFKAQFYGLDYSEKEFEQGTTKKWLYDHGLELEPIENTALLGTLTKGADSMILTTPSSGVSRISTSNAIDITSYSLERMKLGKNVTLYSDTYTCTLGLSGTRDTVSLKGFANSLKALLPNNVGLDISSVNENAYPWIYTSNFAVTCEITEWWLE